MEEKYEKYAKKIRICLQNITRFWEDYNKQTSTKFLILNIKDHAIRLQRYRDSKIRVCGKNSFLRINWILAHLDGFLWGVCQSNIKSSE